MPADRSAMPAPRVPAPGWPGPIARSPHLTVLVDPPAPPPRFPSMAESPRRRAPRRSPPRPRARRRHPPASHSRPPNSHPGMGGRLRREPPLGETRRNRNGRNNRTTPKRFFKKNPRFSTGGFMIISILAAFWGEPVDFENSAKKISRNRKVFIVPGALSAK